MALASLVIKIHYERKFDRSNGCEYVSGKVVLHIDPYDLYCLSFIKAAPQVGPIDKVDEEIERRRLGIGTKWWDNVLSSDDDLYEVDVIANDEAEVGEEVADIGGPSFEVGGPSFDASPSFEVGGPSGGPFDDTDNEHVDVEHVTTDFGDDAPPTCPEGDLLDMVGSYVLVSPLDSEDEVGAPS
ncbi:hypothetical protein CJ030_MR4G018379 [Morella rubra]|uniref:Uncharacterized protein n=1 Tax=Morella rubra TaxID=262757 RepID=A0A6A1VWA2_9ROSI|nr:hypothetical protein CJ030_MR4G018379 [Morella rubra]